FFPTTALGLLPNLGSTNVDLQNKIRPHLKLMYGACGECKLLRTTQAFVKHPDGSPITHVCLTFHFDVQDVLSMLQNKYKTLQLALVPGTLSLTRIPKIDTQVSGVCV
ncbi:uncharacterized protein VICG_02227, partial [Vittaforma corneae ATCC 50505]